MKLRRIRIEQFRKFVQPIEIDGLEHGLNILYGPNEAGKSTISQAIRTLFFEKHNTKGEFVHLISPQGDSRAAPKIAIDFTLGAIECSAEKTFFHAPRASLSIGARRFDAGEVDTRLAQLLGFQLSGRGASKDEHQGIPGLLWIEQGRSGELSNPVDHAAINLADALKGIIGEVASTHGDKLAGRVESERGKLLTATGKTTGDYAAAEKELEQLRQARDGLQARANDYRTLGDRLIRDSSELARLDAAKPWDGYRAQLHAANDRKASLEPQRQIQAQRVQRQRDLELRKDGLHQQLQAHDKDFRALEKLRDQLPPSALQRQQLEHARSHAEARRQLARAALDAARTQQAAAGRAERRITLLQDSARSHAELRRVGDTLKKARALGAQLDALRMAAAAGKLSKADLARLEKLAQALRDNQLTRDAIATRIDYQLDAGHEIDAGAEGVLRDSGSCRITGPVTFAIAGVGRLVVTPGGEDIARLNDQARKLEGDLRALREQLGVRDLDQARERHARYQELEQAIGLGQRQLETLLDAQSEAELRALAADHQGRLDDTARRLEALPESAGETALSADVANLAVVAGEAELAGATAQCDNAAQQANAAQVQWERLSAQIDADSRRLDSEDARQAAERRRRDLAEVIAQGDTLRAEIDLAATAIAKLQPELVDQDIARYGLALKQVELQRQQLAQAISDARAELQHHGADGIDEKLEVATADLARGERRLAQLRLRAQALKMLEQLLGSRQAEATRRLYAPLRERIGHYLGIIFPGAKADIHFDQLTPTSVSRGADHLPYDQFSHGTREQLGVIARLAYADLLKQAGHPTLLILDDALVHSDAERREQMKRVLHDAAGRHQILLFTCHPEHWRDAGARTLRDVAALGGA